MLYFFMPFNAFMCVPVPKKIGIYLGFGVHFLGGGKTRRDTSKFERDRNSTENIG